jgi:hypothetical protein
MEKSLAINLTFFLFKIKKSDLFRRQIKEIGWTFFLQDLAKKH